MGGRFTQKVGRRYIFGQSVGQIASCRSQGKTEADQVRAKCHTVAFFRNVRNAWAEILAEVARQMRREATDRPQAPEESLDDLRLQRLGRKA